MLPDLFAKYTLIGMSETEVRDLLGPGSGEHYFREWSLRYCLGVEQGWTGIDNEWLLVRVVDNRVVEVKVTTD